MKLLTLNCHSWQEENQLEKIKTLASTIKVNSYDVITLQEVSQLIDDKILDHNIKKSNFGKVLLDELNKIGVSDYNMVWDFSHIGYDKYEEGLCILTKHNIEKKYSFYISKNHSIDCWKTRKIVGASININGSIMDFYSCHLGWWDDDEDPFINQVECLLQNIKFDKPTFLMGDFNNNAFIKDEGYSYLMKKNLYDTFLLAHKKDKGITVKGKIDGWDKNEKNMRLDLILVNENLNVKSSKVIFNGINGRVISDHYGVEVNVELQ